MIILLLNNFVSLIRTDNWCRLSHDPIRLKEAGQIKQVVEKDEEETVEEKEEEIKKLPEGWLMKS